MFVKFFKWGVAGVAWATFIAQGVACVFSLLILVKKTAEIKTEDKPPLFSGKILKKITLYSIPSILQQSFISVGNIFVQYLVNSFGSSCIAGYSSAIKLNTFAITSFTTLSNGLSSFVAQNYGAGRNDRIKSGNSFRKRAGRAATVPKITVTLRKAYGLLFLYAKNYDKSVS